MTGKTKSFTTVQQPQNRKSPFQMCLCVSACSPHVPQSTITHIRLTGASKLLYSPITLSFIKNRQLKPEQNGFFFSTPASKIVQKLKMDLRLSSQRYRRGPGLCQDPANTWIQLHLRHFGSAFISSQAQKQKMATAPPELKEPMDTIQKKIIIIKVKEIIV